MNDHRAMLLAVCAYVAEIELVRQMEIDLNRGIGFLVAHHVGELDIQLRAVEGRFTGSLGVRKAERIHRFAENVFGQVPHFVVGHIFLGILFASQREPIAVLSDAEIAVRAFDQSHDAGKFVFDLFGGAENVRVIQGHGANAA